MTAFEIFELGDHALVATAVDAVSFETQRHIWRIAELARAWPDVEEAIPGMNNITLVFDPLATDLGALRARLERVCVPFGADDGTDDAIEDGPEADGRDAAAQRASDADTLDEALADASGAAGSTSTSTSASRSGTTRDTGRAGGTRKRASRTHADDAEPHDLGDAPGRLIELPVHYGGVDGPDIEAVARHAGLSVEALIERHAQTEYTVYFLGFQPGFAYLGGLDPALAAPRRKEPRVRVPAGSVGIGGAQTGVYPTASPGGWQLIGRTPATLFDAERDPPSLLAPGDRVRFVPSGGAR
ncbi:5-oxoprolinase subunit PxpB [Pararobbsia silviterrae]|uniref:5-oxoprolinase subunit PxpB n=1 Tax=Pararobbsia silviterrae TaxID=1792498 RepID=A0A494YCU1_9BURK|nr:5-oxoprolinase subunit PxpB [Pararobbsia silviterrae]